MLKMKTIFLIILFLHCTVATSANLITEKNKKLAYQLTALLRSARKVISSKKELIADVAAWSQARDRPGVSIIQDSKKVYATIAVEKYPEIDKTFRGKAIKNIQKAIVNVFKKAAKGQLKMAYTGTNSYVRKTYRGLFLPARFAHHVINEFNILAHPHVKLKMTTSEKLLINSTNRPDAWETHIIKHRYMDSKKKQTKPFTQIITEHGKPVFRYILPEYYAASCLRCHGTKGGDGLKIHPNPIPRELDDFGGAITVTITR